MNPRLLNWTRHLISRFHSPKLSVFKAAFRSRQSNPRFRQNIVADIQVLESRTLLSAFSVTNVNDSGDGSLRQAILDANASPNVGGPDTISFNIPGTGVHTISPSSQLPSISDPVVINGYTQAGASPNTFGIGAGSPGHDLGDGDNAVLTIELDGTFAGDSATGLLLQTGNCTIEGLVVNRFGNFGIAVWGLNTDFSPNPNVSGNTIAGNFIGTDVTGKFARGNGGGTPYQILNNTSNAGILLASTSNNVIGGTAPAARNIISGNGGDGIVIQDSFLEQTSNNNQVQGNLIGTDASGKKALGNASNGVVIELSSGTVIGGSDPAARNIISGSLGTRVFDTDNDDTGLGIFGCSVGSIIQGNYIGTDITGSSVLGNQNNGICAVFASDVTIGGTDLGAGNLISGNGGYGGIIIDVVNGALIEGNFIGTDATGTAAVGTQTSGIILVQCSGVVIGGTTAAARNVISGSWFAQIDIRTNGATIQGNYLGTDVTGSVSLNPGQQGIYLGDIATNNLIGGTTVGAGNLIAGDSTGIGMQGIDVSGNLIQGNRIGWNSSSTGSIVTYTGIFISGVGSNNVIGGSANGAGNNINVTYTGVVIAGSGVSDDQILGNTIAMPSATGDRGITLLAGTNNNIVGGTEPGEGNIISGANYGVLVDDDSRGNAIRGNLIGSTNIQPIGLGFMDGADANDLLDLDTGPNDRQNHPDITSATVGILTHVTGTLDSSANETFSIDFYAGTGLNQPLRYIGSTEVTTNDAGHADFDLPLTAAVAADENIFSTATNSSRSTSEMSPGAPTVTVVTNHPATITGTTSGDVTEDAIPNTATGQLTVTDPDPGQAVAVAQSNILGTYGSFSVTAAGIWTYSLDNSRQIVQALTSGQQVHDSFTVTSADGTASQTVTINIHGADELAANGGILLLDASGKGALSDSGNGEIIVGSGGSIIVASNNVAAIIIRGNGVVSASQIDVESSTGTLISGNGEIVGQIDRNISASEAVDPLATLSAPSTEGSQFTATNISDNSVVTLQPGTYNGGIQISGDAKVTLAPGIYYINGGGFSVTGNAIVTGNGVFIYNAPQTSSDGINLAGSASVTLTAMSSGAYQGITIYQDRTSSAAITISSYATLTVTGAVYAARATMNVLGSGLFQLKLDSELILDDLMVAGNGMVAVNV